MNIQVLVVEDDPVFREGFAEAIAGAADMTLAGTAGDLATGLALLDRQPQVLLVDLGLPDGSGIELIREATRRLPDIDVMVVTVFGDEASVMDSIAAGATGYLLKDMPPAELLVHVRELRAGGSPISPGIARQLLNRLPRGSARTGDDEASLSEQEIRVLDHAARGFSYEEIAQLLRVSRHSVQTYVKRAYRKLNVHSKIEAVAEARRLRLL